MDSKLHNFIKLEASSWYSLERDTKREFCKSFLLLRIIPIFVAIIIIATFVLLSLFLVHEYVLGIQTFSLALFEFVVLTVIIVYVLSWLKTIWRVWELIVLIILLSPEKPKFSDVFHQIINTKNRRIPFDFLTLRYWTIMWPEVYREALSGVFYPFFIFWSLKRKFALHVLISGNEENGVLALEKSKNLVDGRTVQVVGRIISHYFIKWVLMGTLCLLLLLVSIKLVSLIVSLLITLCFAIFLWLFFRANDLLFEVALFKDLLRTRN